MQTSLSANCRRCTFAKSAVLRELQPTDTVGAVHTEDAAGSGLRERKKRATRKRICQAVLDLTIRRGLHQVTVEEISARADVSPRTFFNYFQSKEEAYVAIAMDWVLEVEQRLLSAPDDLSPWHAVEDALLSTALRIEAELDRQVVRRLVEMDQASVFQEHVSAFVALERRLVADVARRMAADRTSDVRPTLLVGACVTGLRVALEVWATTEPQVSLVDVTRRCLDVLGDGLRTDPTLDRPGAVPMTTE